MKRKWIDSMVITAVNFRCQVETLPSGAKRIREAVEVPK